MQYAIHVKGIVYTIHTRVPASRVHNKYEPRALKVPDYTQVLILPDAHDAT